MSHSRHIRSSRAFLVMAWGCLLPYIMVKTTSEATSMRGSITTQELCPKRASSEVLPKTVISSNMRMSVLVGLEGTGHHYLTHAMADMFNSNVEVSENSTLCIKTTPYFTEATMDRSPVAYMNACQYARNEMSKLALQEENLPRPGHLVRLCQEQSYPTGHGASKVLHYIDLPMLAATAEEKGVDLRVVYLKRSAHDILVANTIHRRFQKYLGDDTVNPNPNKQFSKYAYLLMTDAAVIHSFLSEIDPAFVVCHDYAHAGEEEQATRIANFVAPNSAIAGMYNTSLLRTWAKRSSKREEFSFVGSEAVVTWLQKLTVRSGECFGAAVHRGKALQIQVAHHQPGKSADINGIGEEYSILFDIQQLQENPAAKVRRTRALGSNAGPYYGRDTLHGCNHGDDCRRKYVGIDSCAQLSGVNSNAHEQNQSKKITFLHMLNVRKFDRFAFRVIMINETENEAINRRSAGNMAKRV